MKMIDVFDLMAKRQIEEGAKLIFFDGFEEYECTYLKKYRNFVDEDLEYLFERLGIDEDFLNWEVRLEQPSEQKYRIKLPHSEFYVGFAHSKEGKKEFIPYVKDDLIIEMLIQGAPENDLKFKKEFTEQDFEEMEELKPYKAFKELIKDDEK